MNRELEGLLKAWDAFIQSPKGPEAARIYSQYEAQLEEAAKFSKLRKETLHRAVKCYHVRWVRANLPPGFPKSLGDQ